MEYEELGRLLRQKPFQPFRVVLTDGRTYEVHPGMNLLNYSYIKIGIPGPGLLPPICDHTEYVRLSEIARVEMLPTTDSRSA
jgi:hypothetical protein